MEKYSLEFKMEVIKAYMNNEDGYVYLAKKFNIPTKKSVQNWIANYRELGDEGLLRKRQNVKLTLDFKFRFIFMCYVIVL